MVVDLVTASFQVRVLHPQTEGGISTIPQVEELNYPGLSGRFIFIALHLRNMFCIDDTDILLENQIFLPICK